MSQAAVAITVTDRQRAILERLTKSGLTPQYLTERARVVLMSADGFTNVEQARVLGVNEQRVRRWRHRWAAAASKVLAAEGEASDEHDLANVIADTLDDRYRSGAPCRFTAEQVAQIIALACEKPEDSGRPVSHWTPRELADEAVERGIVLSISPRHVDRFFRGRGNSATQVAVLAQREDQGDRPRRVRARRARRL